MVYYFLSRFLPGFASLLGAPRSMTTPYVAHQNLTGNGLYKTLRQPRIVPISQSTSRGFTVLEVIIALFIFGCAVTAIMQLMLTGDRINGRRVGISCATILASNQVETIRLQEASPTLMGDTVYDASLNDLEFEVRRTRIQPPETIRPDTVINYLEFSVMVKRKNDDIPLVNYRLLQGFHGK